ncbi:MAG: tripartite tricarboxylate transporter TctB family protein, partial [Parvibaculaceae bacterium]
MKSFRIDPVNGACGALFAVLGAVFAYESFMLDMGTALRMGPGYFPSMLGLVLLLLGVVILLQATRVGGAPLGPMAWRGMLLILPA